MARPSNRVAVSADQVRRLLAIAAILDGGSRREAARAGPYIRKGRTCLKTCPFIDFKNPEGIALRINEIALPALAGDREFGLLNEPAKPLYCLLGCIEILDLDRANKGIRAALGWGTYGCPWKQPSVGYVRFDPPIGFGTFILGKPQPKT